jgi:hypothetical protein
MWKCHKCQVFAYKINAPLTQYDRAMTICNVGNKCDRDQETFVTNQIATRFCSSKRIYLTSNPHESCSPVRLDEFGVLNRLILISKAQDIPL